MRLRDDRRGADQAAAELIMQRRDYLRQSQWLREVAQRHQPALIAGGGFLAGLILGQVRSVAATRKLGTLFGLASVAVRSALGRF